MKRTVSIQAIRAGNRATSPASRGTPQRAASAVLVDELREGLGERRLSEILKAIRDELATATGIQTAEGELARMRAENAARLEAKRAAILDDAVNSDVAGEFIARTRPVVNRLAKAGELLALQDGRYLRFPRWQFDERSEDGLVPGLRRVLAVMDASPFRIAAWLVSPNPHFSGRAPIEMLREGHIERVYEEAKAVTSG